MMTAYLLCDASVRRSAATDTRAERRRFVTNACVYRTFAWGVQLGIVDENELKRLLGRDLAQYKRDLLRLFGKAGYISIPWMAPRGRRCPRSRWISSACIAASGI